MLALMKEKNQNQISYYTNIMRKTNMKIKTQKLNFYKEIFLLLLILLRLAQHGTLEIKDSVGHAGPFQVAQLWNMLIIGGLDI